MKNRSLNLSLCVRLGKAEYSPRLMTRLGNLLRLRLKYDKVRSL